MATNFANVAPEDLIKVHAVIVAAVEAGADHWDHPEAEKARIAAYEAGMAWDFESWPATLDLIDRHKDVMAFRELAAAGPSC